MRLTEQLAVAFVVGVQVLVVTRSGVALVAACDRLSVSVRDRHLDPSDLRPDPGSAVSWLDQLHRELAAD